MGAEFPDLPRAGRLAQRLEAAEVRRFLADDSYWRTWIEKAKSFPIEDHFLPMVLLNILSIWVVFNYIQLNPM